MENGEWKYYYENSNILWHKNNYKNGKLDGELTSYYKDGKLKRSEFHNATDDVVTGKCYDMDGKEIAFSPFETLPKPTFDLIKYLSENLHYPDKARRHNTKGRVITKFVVDENGKIIDVTIVQHVSAEIDAEAIRVISTMPQWIPGMQDDKIVKVYFSQPLSFNLE